MQNLVHIFICIFIHSTNVSTSVIRGLYKIKNLKALNGRFLWPMDFPLQNKTAITILRHRTADKNMKKSHIYGQNQCFFKNSLQTDWRKKIKELSILLNYFSNFSLLCIERYIKRTELNL